MLFSKIEAIEGVMINLEMNTLEDAFVNSALDQGALSEIGNKGFINNANQNITDLTNMEIPQ